MRYYFKFLIFSFVVSGITLFIPFQCKSEEENAFTRGAKAWAETCATCHNSRPPQEFRPDQWKTIMAHMRVVAKISGQTARDILAFLAGEKETDSAQLAETIECPEEEDCKETRSKEEPSKEEQADKTKPSEVKPLETKPSEVKPSETKSSETKPSEVKKVAVKEQPTGKAASSSESPEMETLYSQYCAACHGKDGKGGVGGAPDFTSSSSLLKTGTEDTIFKRINEGGHGMPAAPQQITDEQIKGLIRHLKGKFAQ